MPNAWFRLYTEFAHDPKVQIMSEAMQRRLMMIFCLKGEEMLETLHETELAFHLRISMADLAETKALFLEKEFIDEKWNPVNWNKRQYISDCSTERVRKHRQGLKQSETFHETHETVNETAPEQNRTETEQKKATPKPSPKASPSSFAPPLWIHPETWRDFEEMRKKLRAPLTDRARQGIVADLHKLQLEGQDPDAVLVQSITKAWRGVFAVKADFALMSKPSLPAAMKFVNGGRA